MSKVTRMLSPLKHRRLSYLWGGQVFSAIGDELYAVALVWMAATLVGTKAGYIVAVQAASVLICSLFGGIWADQWDHRRTMFFVDLLRGFAVLLLPLAAIGGFQSIEVLILVTVVVSSCRAFFEPALRACLPRLAGSRELLQTTNALMETTSRLAKILGPGLLGILSQAIPVIHYFTFDAVSFFVSAFSIHKLKTDLPNEVIEKKMSGFSTIKEGLTGGYFLSHSRPLIHFVILTDAIVNSAWLFIFPLTIGILIHEKMPDQISALGLLVGAYGVGNLASNLVLGSIVIRRFDRCLFWGRIIAGTGVIILANAPSFAIMMIAAAFAAIAGPMADLSKLSLIQQAFQPRDIAKIYRFNMVASYLVFLFALLISPTIFSLVSVASAISVAAAVMVFFGLLGLVLRKEGGQEPNPN